MLLAFYGGSNTKAGMHRADYLEFFEIFVGDELQKLLIRRDIVFNTLTLRICPYYYTNLLDPKTKVVTHENFLVSLPAIVWGTLRFEEETEDYIPMNSLRGPIFNFGDSKNLDLDHLKVKMQLINMLVEYMEKEKKILLLQKTRLE